MSKKVSRGNRVFKHKKRKESMDTTKSQFELFLAKKKKKKYRENRFLQYLYVKIERKCRIRNLG